MRNQILKGFAKTIGRKVSDILEKKYKQIFALAVAVIVVFVLLFRFDETMGFFGAVFQLISPIAIGLLLAFIFNVPVSAVETRLYRWCEKKGRAPKEKRIRLFSLFFVIFMVLFVLLLLITLIVPELVATVKSIATLISKKWPFWLEQLERLSIDTSSIRDTLESIDLKSIVPKVANHAGAVLGSVAGVATSTFSVLGAFFAGVVIAIYVLISKKNLGRQVKKLLYAYMRREHADRILHIAAKSRDVYGRYLAGQCKESCILGLMILIAFSIFRLPYALLIALVTAVFAIVPYFGAFIACGLGVILALMISPQKALMCMVVYLCVQYVENQFIYPHVVGNSVGLSPLWTLISVLIGGKLFGLIGMILFIPLFAVIYELIKENSDKRLKEKNIIIE